MAENLATMALLAFSVIALIVLIFVILNIGSQSQQREEAVLLSIDNQTKIIVDAIEEANQRNVTAANSTMVSVAAAPL